MTAARPSPSSRSSGILLTVLALAVVQLALALHVRNTVLDAAAEGAQVCRARRGV